MVARIGRNQRCPCRSGRKYKQCCITRQGKPPSFLVPSPGQKVIDYGEDAIRWVICNNTGTSFFVDKQGRILVFSDKAVAQAAATLEVFSDAGPNEINVAGVGKTKWQHLQDTLPHIEVDSLEMAKALIDERLAAQREQVTEEDSKTVVQEFPTEEK